MGVVPLAQLDSAYARIKDAAVGAAGRTSTLVLIAQDADSLCALRILTTLFKSDCILHEIVPVSGYADLRATLCSRIAGIDLPPEHDSTQDDNHIENDNDDDQDLQPVDPESTDIRSVILLNCGAVVQLRHLIPVVQPFEANNTDNTTTPSTGDSPITYYICDSHRPYNLHTLFGEKDMVVLDDGDVAEMDDLRDAYVALEFDSDSSSDDDDDDDSDSSASSNEGSDSKMEGDEDDDEATDDENGSSSHKTKSHKKDTPLQERNGTHALMGSDDENDDDENSTTGSSRSGGQENSAPSAPTSKKRTIEDVIDRRRAKRQASYIKRKVLENKKKLISNYYAEGSYFGTSVASLMYALALQLGKANRDILWYAILGTTDQYLHQKIDLKKYIRQVELFKDEVLRYNVPPRSDPYEVGTSSQGANELDKLFGISNDNPTYDTISGGGAYTIGTTPMGGNRNVWGVSGQASADDSTIVADDEFRLMLLRHWSLYEALCNSDYVATKLGIWKERGQKRLKRFLVKLGLPHKDSQQLFSEMSASFKRPMKENLKQLAAKYNMGEIFFPSFFRHYGFKGTLSAADAVYSINALLDSGAQYLLKSQNSERAQFDSAMLDGNTGREEARNVGLVGLTGVGVGTKTGIAGVHHRVGSLILERVSEFRDNGVGDDEMIMDSASDGFRADSNLTAAQRARLEQKRAWAKNFYVAYDALTNYDILYHGIHLSMMFQKVLISTGISIIEKKLTQNLRSFSLVVLHGQDSAAGSSQIGGNEDEFTFFGRNVSQLGRLSKFLMGVFREYKQKDMPLVIAALDGEAAEFTVVGFTGSGKTGHVRKNKFGAAFKHASAEMGAEIKFDSFEMSVVSVPKDDLSEFLEHLLNFVSAR